MAESRRGVQFHLRRRFVTHVIMHTNLCTRNADTDEESAMVLSFWKSRFPVLHPLCSPGLGTGTDGASVATLRSQCLPARSSCSGRDFVRAFASCRQGFAALSTAALKKTSPKTRQRMSPESHRQQQTHLSSTKQLQQHHQDRGISQRFKRWLWLPHVYVCQGGRHP